MRVHNALNKIIPLHPVLMSRAVREMSEGSFAQFVLFQFPEILQLLTGFESNWPVVISSVDRICQRTPLRMALYARVSGLDGAKADRVYDVRNRRMPDVFTPRAVALFAADIPFRYALRLHVIVHRMATIAQRSGRALHIVWRIKGSPPVGAVLYKVWEPLLMSDIPLSA